MKKLWALIAVLFLVTMSSCAVTSEGSGAGQNETGVNGPQTATAVPMWKMESIICW